MPAIREWESRYGAKATHEKAVKSPKIFDHHDNEAGILATLLDELARTLAEFGIDLGTRMASTSVVTMTEFGRRAAQNASGGTDHGSGYGMLLMGGGVLGRNVYRSWPGLAKSWR